MSNLHKRPIDERSLPPGYFILARWITGAPTTMVRALRSPSTGGFNEKSNANLGPNGGLVGVGTHRAITINRAISPVDVGAEIAQLGAKLARLGGEELLQYLLCEKREVSRT